MSGFAPHALFNHGAGFAEQLFLNAHDIAVIRDRRTGGPEPGYSGIFQLMFKMRAVVKRRSQRFEGFK